MSQPDWYSLASMELTTLDEMLRREPFQPLRLLLSNGQRVDILDPSLVVPMKREIFVANRGRDGFRSHSMLHIVGAESINGSNGQRSNG